MAEEFKSQANNYFKVGDWERATLFYTKAIEVCEDSPVLYTNRAQAYLRAGLPEHALTDCGMALGLLPLEPQKTSTDVDEDAELARSINTQVGKAHLCRGKALLTLRRPLDALHSYVNARAFRVLALHPASKEIPDPDSNEWPLFLREYVMQAQAALVAERLCSQTPEEFGVSTRLQSTIIRPMKEYFMQLIADAVSGDPTNRHYRFKLRQILTVLNAAKAESSLLPSVNGSNAADKQATIESVPTGDHVVLRNRRKHKKRKNRKTKITSSPSTFFDVVTLRKLQSCFRTNNGFEMLESQMKHLTALFPWQRFWHAETVPSAALLPNHSEEEGFAALDHLITLITLCNLLARDCDENRRLLVKSMLRHFSPVLVDCLQVSPLSAPLLSTTYDSEDTVDVNESKLPYLLGLLRSCACELLALVSSKVRDCDDLFGHHAPTDLLTALAVCLKDALGLTTRAMGSVDVQAGQKNPSGHQQMPPSVKDCFATQTVAGTSRILENLTANPRFLDKVRSSYYYVDGLLDVIAVAIAPTQGCTSLTSTSVSCLSQLIGCLSSISDNSDLRPNTITRPRFFINLTNCASQHVPFLTDERHATLVGSICWLLYSFHEGHPQLVLTRAEMESLLNLIGRIVDQPSRTSDLVSVAVALLGQFLPTCPADLIEKWCHTGKDAVEMPINKRCHAMPKLKERINILVVIVSSYSASVLEAAPLPFRTADDPSKIKGAPSTRASSENLAGIRLLGAIRALSCITGAPGCCDIRVAIGDNRVIVRRLAQLVRACASPVRDIIAKLCSRDEALATDVCLILESCAEDTKMAEDLVGTSIVLDLLELIQKSSILRTKRTAGNLVDLLASASHIHRENVSRKNRLSGMTSLGSWTSSFGLAGRHSRMLF